MCQRRMWNCFITGGRRPKVCAFDIVGNDIASTRQVHRVDDLDGLGDRLKGAGAVFVSPGIVTLADGGRAVTIRDPDGHMIVLTQ